eukprot:12410315-Karenia_brevis.AAC.1
MAQASPKLTAGGGALKTSQRHLEPQAPDLQRSCGASLGRFVLAHLGLGLREPLEKVTDRIVDSLRAVCKMMMMLM